MPEQIRIGNKLQYSIVMRLSCQKKMWLGWFRYSTHYHGRITVNHLTVPFAVESMYSNLVNSNGIELKKAPFTLNPDERVSIFVDTSPFGDIGTFTHKFGQFQFDEINKEEFYTVPHIKGTMEVWSRGVSMAEKGVDVLDIKFKL